MEYRTEYLGSGVSVAVSTEHCFGTDAVLLADFAAPKKKDTVCDFGTGCGIIPMIFCRNGYGKSIVGIEIQKQGYEQCRISAQISNVCDKVSFYNINLKDVKSTFNAGSFDVVTMNPPYKKINSGIISQTDCDKIARHETQCTLDDVCKSASYLLKFGGKLCLCNRPERLCDTITAMKDNGIEPKRLRFVTKKADTKPWLFLIEGKKGSKPFLNVESNLIMYNNNGELTNEVIEIYGEYKDGQNR